MTDSEMPSELQLGALYGRYRGWHAPATPVADADMSDDANTAPAASLAALVVQFEASAREDFRLGFAASSAQDDVAEAPGGRPPRTDWAYEVAVGSSGNTEVVWRKSASGRNREVELTRVFAGRTCSAQDFVSYWAVVHLSSGSMAFGIGADVGKDVVATCTDPEFAAVGQAAFTTWNCPASLRQIRLHGVFAGQTEARQAADVTQMAAPRLIVRADPLGTQDLLTDEQRIKYKTEYAASKHRADRFGAPFTAPELRKFLDPREVRKLQRTGAIAPGFSTGLDLTSQEEQSKREQRMKRFDTPQFAVEYSTETARALAEGLTQDEWAEKQRDEEKLRARAIKFGLSAEEDHAAGAVVTAEALKPASSKVQDERRDVKASDDGDVRFRDDAVHVYSLDERFQQVRTSDVMDYFVGYGPAYVEWINDSSCTVVFQDNFTAGRALIALSREIPAQSIKHKQPQTTNTDAETTEDVDMGDSEAAKVDGEDATAMEDEPEQQDVPDESFNRSQWRLANPIGSSSQPRDKKWRLLLRKATDEDFPAEKGPRKYHARGSQRVPARQSRSRRGDREADGSTSARSRRDARPRAQPYGFREDRRGDGPRRRRDDRDDDRDTGKPSKRIRMNADGSIDVIRAAAAAAAASTDAPAAAAAGDSKPKPEPTTE